ncbi:MAG: glycosyltransferase [Chthoniobacteraceae bacterium]
MKFTIITPSLRQLPWLKRCVRSVADQAGVEVEHLVQDGGSGPELEAWARTQPSVDLAVEPDRGMYDAINTALSRASGDVCGILNCDEQYLPGTLARVAAVFAREPSVDFVAGDYLVVDPQQQLLAFRKVTPLRPSMILTDHLYAFTCALFFRRSVFESAGAFDASLKSVADGEWVARALGKGHRAALLHEWLATFTWTGGNLSAHPVSRAEEEQLRARLPIARRLAAPLLRAWRRVERWLADGYRSGPISYEVFVGDGDARRTRLECERPSFRYPGV